VLQSCSSVSAGHAAPPYSASWVTSRVRVCLPPPHSLVQPSHSPKSPTLQSTGHSPSSQGADSSSTSHAAPPNWGAVSTVRDLFFNPSPQLLEHLPYAPQAESRQSIGHFLTSHAFVSSSPGHALPPNCASVSTVRVRFCCPGPHSLSQSDHSPNALTAQLIGHFFVSQALLSSSPPHALPPFSAAFVTVLDRFCCPGPHSLSHTPHSLKALSTQSTGHGSDLQACVSSAFGHAAPPCAAAVATLRVLF